MIKKIDGHFSRLGEKSKSAAFRRGVLIAVVVIQLIVMCVFAAQKSNYYIDEMFSMGYAHTYTHPWKDVVYINQSAAWENEQWIDNGILKNQLETTKEDSVFAKPFPETVRALFFRRNYMGMLNVLMSTFAPGRMTAYPAIALNLILFIFTQLLLYRVCRELTGSFSASVMAVFMYGFSAMAIGLCMFVRFYAWVILLLLAVIRLQQKMWSERGIGRSELWTVFSMILIYLALKNSELVFIVAGALIGFYALGLTLTKQWKKLIAYILTIVPISLIYAVSKTPFVDMILHPGNYTDLEGPMGWMTRDLMTITSGRITYLLRLYRTWLNEQLFGSGIVAFSFVIILLLLLEVKYLGKIPAGKRRESGAGDKGKTPCKRRAFAWILLGVTFIYLLFALLTGLPATRYICFTFPIFTLLLWTALSGLTEGNRFRTWIVAGCALLTCIGAVLGLAHPERVEYIYMEDRPLISALQEKGITDSVVIYTNEEDATHVVYDCVNLMPDEARIYPVQAAHHSMDAEQFPDEVLVWVKNREDVHACLTDLETNGYQVTWLGKTHCSDVYAARRKGAEQSGESVL